jgi:hypothetical protein
VVELSQKVSNEELDWAYEVLVELRRAFLECQNEPAKLSALMADVVRNLPDIIEAFLTFVDEGHRAQVGRILFDILKVIASCQRL